MARAEQYDAPLGVPPSIEFKAVAELQVDPSYQRDAGAGDSQSLIRQIARSWDWRLCAPLTVSRRVDPHGFFVIDGQHRLEAAKLRGDIDYLPCIVSTFASLEDEARCFVAVNTRRKRINALDTFRAQLAAGDEESHRMHRLITGAGLTLARHTNTASWKPLQFGSLGGLRNAIARHGEAVAARALGDVASAFANEPLRSAGTILIGLYAIHGDPPPDFDADRFRTTLASRSQGEWMRAVIQRQAKYGELVESAITWSLLDALRGKAAA